MALWRVHSAQKGIKNNLLEEDLRAVLAAREVFSSANFGWRTGPTHEAALLTFHGAAIKPLSLGGSLGICPMLIPQGIRRALGVWVNLERLQITYIGQEQQSPKLALHCSAHPQMNLAQDMNSLEQAFQNWNLVCVRPDKFAITADDSHRRSAIVKETTGRGVNEAPRRQTTTETGAEPPNVALKLCVMVQGSRTLHWRQSFSNE